MDTPMEYRADAPEAHGYEDATEQLLGMRYQIQMMMEHSSPEDIIDMLLILSNICEFRATMSAPSKPMMEWYGMVKELTRGALAVLDKVKDGARPDIKLENQLLYWPNFDQTH